MSTRSRRGQAQRALYCAVLLGVSATLVFSSPAAAVARDGQQLRKATIAIIPVDPTALVMYAKDQGFFRKQGIDAEIMIVGAGQAVPAVISGQAQFAAIPAAALAQLKSRGGPFKAVAAGALYKPRVATTVLVAAPGERIGTARDLVGKRVGIDSPNSIAHVGLLRWLDRGGVEADDIDLLTASFPELLGPLARGEIDAAMLPEPWVTLALQRGAKAVALPFDAVCSQDCLVLVYMASRNVDPDLAARFRNAVQAAAVWANQKRNQPASARILARHTKTKVKLIEKMVRTTYATRLRPRMAQPWLDLYGEYDLIPDGYQAGDLVK